MILVMAVCSWVVFREPWEVSARRAHRRAWRALMKEQRSEAASSVDHAGVAADGIVEINSPSELGAFVRSCPGDVHLDLSEVETIDTVGFCALLDAQRLVEANGNRLVLTGLDARRRRVFEAAHLDDVLTVA